MNVSPALALGGYEEKRSNSSKGGWGKGGHEGGDASTSNGQGNGNKSGTVVVQGNNAEQTQRSKQHQTLTQTAGAVEELC